MISGSILRIKITKKVRKLVCSTTRNSLDAGYSVFVKTRAWSARRRATVLYYRHQFPSTFDSYCYHYYWLLLVSNLRNQLQSHAISNDNGGNRNSNVNRLLLAQAIQDRVLKKYKMVYKWRIKRNQAYAYNEPFPLFRCAETILEKCPIFLLTPCMW